MTVEIGVSMDELRRTFRTSLITRLLELKNRLEDGSFVYKVGYAEDYTCSIVEFGPDTCNGSRRERRSERGYVVFQQPDETHQSYMLFDREWLQVPNSLVDAWLKPKPSSVLSDVEHLNKVEGYGPDNR